VDSALRQNFDICAFSFLCFELLSFEEARRRLRTGAGRDGRQREVRTVFKKISSEDKRGACVPTIAGAKYHDICVGFISQRSSQ